MIQECKNQKAHVKMLALEVWLDKGQRYIRSPGLLTQTVTEELLSRTEPVILQVHSVAPFAVTQELSRQYLGSLLLGHVNVNCNTT